MEIGCGTGPDAGDIVKLGFDYLGLDVSGEAVRLAESCHASDTVQFVQADFLAWSTEPSFDVIYDKGLFHGLPGVRRRNAVVRRIALALRSRGIWITVCGSADRRREDFCHGATYLRDLIAPAEICFEVLEVVKASYGLGDDGHDFEAWHAAFRRQ